MNITQLIASLCIVSACTLLTIHTGTFRNLFVKLLLAGFVAVVLGNETSTPPVMIWSAVCGLLYVLCVDLMADTLNTKPMPGATQTRSTGNTPQQQEADIHDLFEFEPLGGDQ